MGELGELVVTALVGAVLLLLADCFLYLGAPYPERARRWWRYLPGSGLLLFLRRRRRSGNR
jgi:hypothetical protein